MGTIGTGLQGRHEHDLMQTEGNRPSFFLFPLEACIKRLGRDGKHILKIRGHQNNTIFKRQRRFTRHIAENPGGGRQQCGHRNSRQEFPAEKIPGQRGIIDQCTNQCRPLKRTALTSCGEYDRSTDRTEIHTGGDDILLDDVRLGQQVRYGTCRTAVLQKGERGREGRGTAHSAGRGFRSDRRTVRRVDRDGESFRQGSIGEVSMPVFRSERQIRPDGQSRNIMGIQVEDFFLCIYTGQTYRKAAFQRQSNTDGIIFCPFKSQQSGTNQGFPFRQTAERSTKTVRKRRKDRVRRNSSSVFLILRNIRRRKDTHGCHE